MFLLSSTGTSVSALDLGVGYQHGFRPAEDVEPYVTTGVRLFHSSISSQSTNNPGFGVGLGVRTRVAEGHGSGRFEVRYDHFFEDSSGFDGGNAIALKVGFDLWLSSQ
jgi:hypothetical protein